MDWSQVALPVVTLVVGAAVSIITASWTGRQANQRHKGDLEYQIEVLKVNSESQAKTLRENHERELEKKEKEFQLEQEGKERQQKLK